MPHTLRRGTRKPLDKYAHRNFTLTREAYLPNSRLRKIPSFSSQRVKQTLRYFLICLRNVLRFFQINVSERQLTSEQVFGSKISPVLPLYGIIRNVEVLKERQIAQRLKGSTLQLVAEIDHPVHIVVKPQMNLVATNILCFCNL